MRDTTSAEGPLFSVAIPSRNGREQLELTLASIAEADFDLGRIEVIVVDDGSTDGTYEAFRDRNYPFAFQIHQVELSSQSATTNECIRRAGGTYLLSSAQDILFDPGLFREHLKMHERFAGEDVIVLGYLPYARHLRVTPFMHYLVSGGYQFAYYLIRDPYNVPPNFLYAPNFSVRRERVVEAGLFDERFPFGCQDTDLGIRLARRGVGLVYNPEAVGYHNHPVELDAYCRRQETVGHAVLQLERKHPDLEGGHAVLDMAIHQHLMCSDVQLDRTRAAICELEGRLARHGDYQRLWDAAFCGGAPLVRFSADERRLVALVESLFKRYQTILGFWWAKGYLEEMGAVDGTESLRRRVEARLLKGQASIPVRRTLERRLRELGIEMKLCRSRDYRTSRVVYGLRDYSAALALLESYDDPPAARCNEQLVVVPAPGALSTEQAARLAEVAEVIPCQDLDAGVLEGLSRCEAEIVSVTAAHVRPVHAACGGLAEKVFARVPEVAVIGGGFIEADGRARFGHRHDGASLTRREGDGAGAVPVEVAIAEYCWLRRSALPRPSSLAAREGRSWNFHVCREVSRARRLVLHVPELVARRSESAAAAHAAP